MNLTERATEARAIYHLLARIAAESLKVREGKLSSSAFHTRVGRDLDDATRIAEHHSQQLNAALLEQSRVIAQFTAPGRAGIATVSTGLRDIISQHPDDFCAIEDAGTLPDTMTTPEEA